MPVSMPAHISLCLNHIIQLAPASVLDVGCGFGLWGFLCREYLDVFNERVQPETWKVRIDGLELFEPYIQAHQRHLYNSILIGDVRAVAPTLDTYDLIIAGDVIEHLDKDEAMVVLDLLYKKAGRALLVNIPLGPGWDHPETHGNPGELHRSQWEVEDFADIPAQFQELLLTSGIRYGVFYCPKDPSPALQAEHAIRTAESLLARHDRRGAIERLRHARMVAPAHEGVVTVLVDMLLQERRVDEALHLLQECIEQGTGVHDSYLLAARILTAVGRRDEAHGYLSTLVSLDIPQEIRDAARQLMEQG